MASNKQIKANRANARKSTGSKSSAGKQNSSKNALTHGNYSRDIVLFDEDPQDFDQLLGEIEEAYPSIDAVDRELNRDLAGQFWRLRRIPIQESALLGSTWEDTIITIFRMSSGEARRKTLKKLGELQKDREAYDPDGFFSDLTQALASLNPQAMEQLLEAEKNRNPENSWLALARRETSLRNGIARTLAMIHARRATRS